jgi:DNA-binding CsgD family transcriptional regulator
LLRFFNVHAPDGWDAGFLVWESAPKPGAEFVAGPMLAPHAREIYTAQFSGRHLWSRRIALQPLGRVVDTDEICTREELFESDLWKSFLSTWSMTHALAAVLDRDGDRRLALVVPGPDGPDLTDLRRGIRLIAPHLQRAVRISRRIARAELKSEAAEASLAQTGAGVVALTRDLAIVNINPAAQRFADLGLARIAEARWRFSDARAQEALKALSAEGEHASTAFTVAQPDGKETAVLAIRIAAKTRATLDGFLEGAAILLTLAGKERAPTIPVDHLAAWFGLTPMEARLASALADGATVKNYAKLRGVSENAVRYLLKGVLRKTNASDQARLVAALRALPSASVAAR